MSENKQTQAQIQTQEKSNQELEAKLKAEVEAAEKIKIELEAKLKAELEAEKKAKDSVELKVKENHKLSIYNRFIDLKFIKLDGGKLREEIEKEFSELEKEVKSFKGKKPNKTVTAAFGNNTVKLCEGIAVPDSVYKFIESTGKADYYFD